MAHPAVPAAEPTMNEHGGRRWSWLISGVGLVTWLGFGFNLLYELDRLVVVAPPVLAFLLGSGLSAALVVAGWLIARETWVDGHAAKRVTGWCLAGGVGAAVTQLVIVLILVAEQRPVAEPQLQLLVGTTGGLLAGTLFGFAYERARHDADRAEQARDAVTFMNRTLRHECLNGLNVIMGRAAQLRAENPEAVQDERLETIHTRASVMAEMVDNIRSFGETFESGQSVTTVDLSTRLRKRVTGARGRFPAAVIDADIPDGVHVAAGEALDRVFENLLQNAVEHNDADQPEIAVRVQTTPETVTVHVADNGPGIPAEERESLFEPELERQHRFGLYLVRTLVTYYGGEISVADNEPRGTVMCVELRRAEPP